jgi:ABC-type branched-subunit amino acid transport system ATPase component
VATKTLLQVEGLTKHFGGIVALADYNIDISAGDLIGLIGPNGAGKTTVFNLLSGVLKPTSGRILFSGHDITRLRPDQNAALGIARTFQKICQSQIISRWPFTCMWVKVFGKRSSILLASSFLKR